MKVKLCRLCIYFLLCLVCGCSQATPLVQSLNSVHHEYGDSVHDQDYNDQRLINITYPKKERDLLDEEIQARIAYHRQAFERESKKATSTELPELNIDYQSYIKDDRYISIKLDVFSSLSHPQEQVETIVYDSQEDSILTISDVMNDEALNLLSDMAKEYFQNHYPDECYTRHFAIHIAPSAHNFNTFVMRKDTLVFYFAADTLFDYGVAWEVPYEHLDDYIDMEKEETAVFVPYQDVLNEPIKNIDPNQPMVALTFDDGPTRKYTEAILDCLKENQASATFFVLGSRADDCPDLLQRMVLEGNEIGNHTFSHKQLTTLSKANIEEEIIATQESIHNVTNLYPGIIRPPYGSKNDTVMECARGKRIVTWTIDTEDWRSKNAEAIVNKVIKDVKDGDIILMHDLYASSAEAVMILVPKLQEMGFQLVTVSELYEYGKNDAGKIM